MPEFSTSILLRIRPLTFALFLGLASTGFILSGCGDGGGNDEADAAVDGDAGVGSIVGTVSAADGGDVTGTEVAAAGVEFTVVSDGAYSLADVPVGEQTVTATLAGYAPFSTSVTVLEGQTVAVDIELQLIGDNSDPVVSAFTVDPAVLAISGTATATVIASDPDGDALEYTWTATGGFSVTPTSDPAIATVLAPSEANAFGDVTVSISDGRGGAVMLIESVSTNDNNAPQISTFTATPETVAPGGEVELTVVATDPDGDSLTFEWMVDDSAWTLSPAGTTATLTAPAAFSSASNVTVRVLDGVGGEITDSLAVATESCPDPDTVDCDGDATNGCEGAQSGISQLCAAPSCNWINSSDTATGDGLYWITGGAAEPYEAYCDMTSDLGGWTLLGTISGGDADRWNTESGLWNDSNLVGSPTDPWLDFKSEAWLDFPMSGTEIMIQRRYDGMIQSQVVLDPACVSGALKFADLFTTFDTSRACMPAAMRVVTSSDVGVAAAEFEEGVGTSGLGNVATNGLCWNGEDTAFNTFKGRLVWTGTPSDNGCSTGAHIGGIAVYQNDSGQFENADITGTSWLLNIDYSLTDISIFARDKVGITGVLSAGDPGRWSTGTYARSCDGYRHPEGGYAYRGSIGNGNYRIDPDGDGPIGPVTVFCDMTTDGGGWTALAANGDNTVEETTEVTDCYPLISGDAAAGCGNAADLMNDFTLAGDAQGAISWRYLLAVAYGDTGYTDKIAYFAIDFGSEQPTTEERNGGSTYSPAGLSTTGGEIYCSPGLGYHIVHYCKAGTYNPGATQVADTVGTVFGHNSAPSMGLSTRRTFGFTDSRAHGSHNLFGVDDYQDGWSCSDSWRPMMARGERMVVLVK